jgi:hypothetical protein
MPEVTMDDVERVATKLDAIDLTDEDRTTLHAVFALAGQAAGAGGDEVSGFALDAIQWSGSTGGEDALAGGSLFGTFCTGQHIAGRPPTGTGELTI